MLLSLMGHRWVLFYSLNPALDPSLGRNEFQPLDPSLDVFSLVGCHREAAVSDEEEGEGRSDGDGNGDSGEDGLRWTMTMMGRWCWKR